jgi:hypothetical protein
MDIGQAIQGLIRQSHEQGGRPVGRPRTPADSEEVVIVSAVVYDRDCVRVRVRRQGQSVSTGAIHWRGKTAPTVAGAYPDAPAAARAILHKPGGSLMVGWVSPYSV